MGTLKSYWILLREHIFVAKTLQQNQNDLILLRFFSNILFMLQTVYIILKPRGATCNFFLTLLMQHIAMYCNHQKNDVSGAWTLVKMSLR